MSDCWRSICRGDPMWSPDASVTPMALFSEAIIAGCFGAKCHCYPILYLRCWIQKIGNVELSRFGRPDDIVFRCHYCLMFCRQMSLLPDSISSVLDTEDWQRGIVKIRATTQVVIASEPVIVPEVGNVQDSGDHAGSPLLSIPHSAF